MLGNELSYFFNLAKINLQTIDIIKGGTLPTSDEQGCQMSDAPDENGLKIYYVLDYEKDH